MIICTRYLLSFFTINYNLQTDLDFSVFTLKTVYNKITMGIFKA